MSAKNYRIEELPGLIRDAMMEIHTLVCEIEDLNYELDKLKRTVMDEVLSAMDGGKPLYTNDKTRSLAVEKQLDDSNEYHCLIDKIRVTRRRKETGCIELRFLENVLDCVLSGGMK
jgi:hypothetical protein